MCRSKKDGRQGGGHRQGTRSKWREAKEVRRARIERRNGLSFAVWEHEQEMAALEQEIAAEFADQWQEDWSWTDNLIEPDYGYDDEYYEGGFLSRVQWPYEDLPAPGYDDEPEPRDLDLFLAVDRAVRLQGIEAVRKGASLLAAALNVAAWEVLTCINYTREGYIRRTHAS